jgi:hypothetical protein
MDGRRVHGLAAAVALSMVVLAQSGCVSALATAMYFWKGTNVAADTRCLEGKKVAVVCRPLVELQFSSSRAAGDIAEQTGALLGANARKVTMVDDRKVVDWVDNHGDGEYAALGRGVGADLVVVIELEGFTTHAHPTVLQGKANLNVTVYDIAAGGKKVYEKTLEQIVYPPNAQYSTLDKPEDEFRREFVNEIAQTVGQLFYDHDYYATFAKDAQTLK